jgi:hypothetical protein
MFSQAAAGTGIRSEPRGQKRLKILVSFVAFVFPILVLGGCETRPARAEAASASPTTVWRAVGTWSGRGNSQTESFDVVTGALRLRWETRAAGSSGHSRFRVTLHSAISGRPLQVIVDRTGAGADTAFAEDEPRTSYLVIEAEQVDWSAVLEEAIGTTRDVSSGTH